MELTSVVYMRRPMYHLNIREFKKNKNYIKRHFDFFSPLHRQLGFQQMTDFTWLEDDHLVQKTSFGNEYEIVANFRKSNYKYKKFIIPSKSVLSSCLKTGSSHIYTYKGN